jgi:hypothetical protein
MKRMPHGIVLNLKTHTTKAPGITLDTNGQRRITQGLAGVGPSRLSKVVRNTNIRNPNTRIVKPRVGSNPFRYVGQETDHKWGKATTSACFSPRLQNTAELRKVIAETSLADDMRAIGIRKAMELTKMSQHTTEKLICGEAVKRRIHEHVHEAVHVYKSTANGEQ